MESVTPKYVTKRLPVYRYDGHRIDVWDIRHVLKDTHQVVSHNGRFFLRRTDGRPCHFEFSFDPRYLVRHPDTTISVHTDEEFRRLYA